LGHNKRGGKTGRQEVRKHVRKKTQLWEKWVTRVNQECPDANTTKGSSAVKRTNSPSNKPQREGER